MTHEFKNIVKHYQSQSLKEPFDKNSGQEKEGLITVLATVVHLQGSGYRKPGVRMLILKTGKMIGAVSGGCVEKEVIRQAQEVFKTKVPKIMVYDGRYRLGCEGILYILLEPFNPSERFIKALNSTLENRKHFEIQSYYHKGEGHFKGLGSFAKFSDGSLFSFTQDQENSLNGVHETLSVFKDQMPPCFKLIIIGAEHDAVQLCLFAGLNGWEVTVICSHSDPKTLVNFPAAHAVKTLSEKELTDLHIDQHTAIILMTHSFSSDLKYLNALINKTPCYIGLLGPAQRREKLISQLIERHPEVSDSFLDLLYGPTGLNIGAETPQEIAISIIAEILSVKREQEPFPLRLKSGKILS